MRIVYLQYWYDIDSDSDQWKDEDIFSPTILTNKRARKSSYKTVTVKNFQTLSNTYVCMYIY